MRTAGSARTRLRVLPATASAWADHRKVWEPCVKCMIGRIARNHVFARGVVPCNLLFIGEAPGMSEDLVGAPFVGRSGKLLDEWITTSVGQQYHMPFAITNTVLCRPTDVRGGPNRPPTELEMEACSLRLRDFVLGIADPRAVVLLGRPAARTWAKAQWAADSHLPTATVWHPAAVLRVGGSGSVKDLEQRIKLREFVRSVFS